MAGSSVGARWGDIEVKRPRSWLLWFVIGCGSVLGCDGDAVIDIVEHRPLDAGLADTDPRPVVLADAPPPPIAGGGLAHGQGRAVIADRDRDRVVVVDLERGLPLAEHPARRPGRVALADDRGYVAVAGAVAVVALDDGRRLPDLSTCAAPQGLAVDGRWLHVACRGGALHRIERDTGETVETRWLDPDLRDVLVVGDALWASRFATAEILIVDGPQVRRLSPPQRSEAGAEWQGRVGWRLRRLPDGRVALLHQWHRLDRAVGGYGRVRTDCAEGRVVPGLTVYPTDAAARPASERARHAIGGAVLVVDFAVSGDWIGLATPGERDARDPYAAPPLDQDDLPLRRIPLDRLDGDAGAGARCVAVRAGGHGRLRPVAVADVDGELLFLDRNDGLAWFADRPPPPWLGGAPVTDTGHDLFHIDAGGGVSCANCHPGGGDDAHIWRLGDIGPRRTQPLFSGLTGTAPYHWDGALPDPAALFERVRGRLMGGGPLSVAGQDALVRWLDALEWPAFDSEPAGDAVEAGERVFVRLACGRCHAGDSYTDGRSHPIDDRPIQTPSLRGVGLRGSLTHRGCAEGMAERFADMSDACSDRWHPPIAPGDLAALMDFLSTL